MIDEKCFNKIKKYKNNILSVTGTSGKTTTLKILEEILKNDFKINKTHKNSNSLIGIPWCVNSYFNLNSDYWLIEIGISNKNEMDKLLNLVNPNIRILTNIGVAHTINFSNEDEYFNEKLKFIEKINDNDLLILNNYNTKIKKYQIKTKKKYRILTIGNNKEDYVRLLNHKINTDNISSYAEILTKKGLIKVNYNGINKHTAINMCLAIAYAIYIDLSLNTIQKSLNNFDLYNNRGNVLIKNTFSIYNFSYNSNELSLTENLKDFANIKSKNKIIILGKFRDIKNDEKYMIQNINQCLKITKNILSFSKDINNILNKNDISYSKNYDDFITNLNNIVNIYKYKQKKIYVFIQGYFNHILINNRVKPNSYYFDEIIKVFDSL